jgi:hypothetical protein
MKYGSFSAYFMEANGRDGDWYREAQHADKLRLVKIILIYKSTKLEVDIQGLISIS